jgi:hypothetical protein
MRTSERILVVLVGRGGGENVTRGEARGPMTRQCHCAWGTGEGYEKAVTDLQPKEADDERLA